MQVVKLTTKRQYTSLMKRLEKANYKWVTGILPTEPQDVWGKYRPLVVRIDEESGILQYGDKPTFDEMGCDIIEPSAVVISEFVPAATEHKSPEQRTFRLIRDMPDINKGALFQDNGAETPYMLLTKDFLKFDDNEELFGDNVPALSRKAVENSKWFEEVFQANPVYMNVSEMETLIKFLKREESKKGKK